MSDPNAWQERQGSEAELAAFRERLERIKRVVEGLPNDNPARATFRHHVEVIERAPRIALDVAIPGLMPGRYVRLTTLAVLEEYDVVRFEYEVVPMGEPPTRANARESRKLGPHWWIVSGRDNLGTAYVDYGGTYGLPEDAVVADGQRDLHPAPPAAAQWLEIAFHAVGEPETFEHARYVLRLALPPGAGRDQ